MERTRKLILSAILMLLFECCFASQKIDTNIPHYKILKADGKYVTWKNLTPNKPVMIIYFMPDCSHCQELVKKLAANMSAFKHMEILMITGTKTEFPFLKLLEDFSNRYSLSRYKNVTIGTEYPSYLVNDYYQIQSTPFVGLYRRNGYMFKSFVQPKDISEILEVVKSL